jgi:hypothetical protein
MELILFYRSSSFLFRPSLTSSSSSSSSSTTTFLRNHRRPYRLCVNARQIQRYLSLCAKKKKKRFFLLFLLRSQRRRRGESVVGSGSSRC